MAARWSWAGRCEEGGGVVNLIAGEGGEGGWKAHLAHNGARARSRRSGKQQAAITRFVMQCSANQRI